jgi:hypothetical protein
VRVALLVMALVAGAPVQADQYLKSVSPKSSIDGFLAACRGEAPDAWCRCALRNLVQTREGDFLVDAVAVGRRFENIQISIGTERANALAARHGFDHPTARAILKDSRAYTEAASSSCGR